MRCTRVKDAIYTITAEVWLHPGEAGWHFVTLPPEIADDVRARTAASARPFGSVPARISIGSTTWSTSLFADTKSTSYLLPLKETVRRREGIAAGDTVTLSVSLAI
jgi:hypothetical protein